MKKLHRWESLLILSISAVCALYAQDQSIKEIKDSLAVKTPVNQLLLRSLHSDIILPSSLQDSLEYIPVSLSQALTISNSSLSWQLQQQVDIYSPWKQELTKQNKLSTLNMVLGIAQGAGTAYLLYKHIRKYGLK